jgi:hypothetical protein
VGADMQKLILWSLILIATTIAQEFTDPRFQESWLLFSEQKESAATQELRRQDATMNQFIQAMQDFRQGRAVVASNGLKSFLQDTLHPLHQQALFLQADIAMQQKNYKVGLDMRVQGMEYLLRPQHAQARAEMFLQHSLESQEAHSLKTLGANNYLSDLIKSPSAGADSGIDIPPMQMTKLMRMFDFIRQHWPETPAALQAFRYELYLLAEMKKFDQIYDLCKAVAPSFRSDTEVQKMLVLGLLHRRAGEEADTLLSELMTREQKDNSPKIQSGASLLSRLRVLARMNMPVPLHLDFALPYFDSLWQKHPGDSSLVSLQKAIEDRLIKPWACESCPPAQEPDSILQVWENKAFSHQDRAYWILARIGLWEQRRDYIKAIALQEQFIRSFADHVLMPQIRQQKENLILNKARLILHLYTRDSLTILPGGRPDAIAWMASWTQNIGQTILPEEALEIDARWKRVRNDLQEAQRQQLEYLRYYPNGNHAEEFRQSLCKDWVEQQNSAICLQWLQQWQTHSNWARKEMELLHTRTFEITEHSQPLQSAKQGVEVISRNLDSLRVRYYRIDAEEYFRSHYSLPDELSEVDIALAQPIQDYTHKLTRTHRFLQSDPIPAPEALGAGLYIVQISTDSLEARRPVLISETGLYLQNHHGMVHAWSFVRSSGEPLQGTRILLSNSEGWLECSTNLHGHCSINLNGKSEGTWSALAQHRRGLAWAQIIHNEPSTSELPPKNWTLLTEKNRYQPGDILRYQVYPGNTSHRPNEPLELHISLGEQGATVNQRIPWPQSDGVVYKDSIRIPLLWTQKAQHKGPDLHMVLQSGSERMAQAKVSIIQQVPQKHSSLFLYGPSEPIYAGDTLRSLVLIRSLPGEKPQEPLWVQWLGIWSRLEDVSTVTEDSGIVLSLAIPKQKVGIETLKIALDSAGRVLAEKKVDILSTKTQLQAEFVPEKGQEHLLVSLKAGKNVDAQTENRWQLQLHLVCMKHSAEPQALPILAPIYLQKDSSWIQELNDTVRYTIPVLPQTAYCTAYLDGQAVTQTPNAAEFKAPERLARLKLQQNHFVHPQQPRMVDFNQEFVLDSELVHSGQTLPQIEFTESVWLPKERPVIRLHNNSSQQIRGWFVWTLGDSLLQTQALTVSPGLQKFTGPALPIRDGQVQVQFLRPTEKNTQFVQVQSHLSTKLTAQVEIKKNTRDSMIVQVQAYNARNQPVPSTLRLDVRSSDALFSGLPIPGIRHYLEQSHIFNGSFARFYNSVNAQPFVFARVRQVRQDDGMAELRKERQRMTMAAITEIDDDSRTAYASGYEALGGVGDMLGGLLGGGGGSIETRARGSIAQPWQDWKDGEVLLFAEQFPMAPLHRISLPSPKDILSELKITYTVQAIDSSWGQGVLNQNFSSHITSNDLLAQLKNEKQNALAQQKRPVLSRIAQQKSHGIDSLWYPSELRLNSYQNQASPAEQLYLHGLAQQRIAYCGAEVNRDRCPDFYEWYYGQMGQLNIDKNNEIYQLQNRLQRAGAEADLSLQARLLKDIVFVEGITDQSRTSMLRLLRQKDQLNLEGLTALGKAFFLAQRKEEALELATTVGNRLSKQGSLPHWSAADALYFANDLKALPIDIKEYWLQQIQAMASEIYSGQEACAYLQHSAYRLDKKELVCKKLPQQHTTGSELIRAYRAAQVEARSVRPGFYNTQQTGQVTGQEKIALAEDFFVELDIQGILEKAGFAADAEWQLLWEFPEHLQPLEIYENQKSRLVPEGMRRLLLQGQGGNGTHGQPQVRLRAMQAGKMEIAEPLLWVNGDHRGWAGTNTLPIEIDLQGEARKWSPAELQELGMWRYRQGRYVEALQYLEELLRNYRLSQQNYKDLVAILLDISLRAENSAAVVHWLEQAREHHPDLEIALENLPALVRAYQQENIAESGSYVAAAVLNTMLQNENTSIRTLRNLAGTPSAIQMAQQVVQDYPLTENSALLHYTVAQLLYSYVDSLAEFRDDTWRENHLRQVSASMAFVQYFIGLTDSLTQQQQEILYNSLYTLVNVHLEEKQPAKAIRWTQLAMKRLQEKDRLLSLGLLQVFAQYQAGDYKRSLETLSVLRKQTQDPNGEDQRLQYYAALIYHAQGVEDSALFYYRQVQNFYPDAAEYVHERERVQMEVPALVLVQQGQTAQIPVSIRNIKEIDVRVFRLDVFDLLQSKGSLKALDELKVVGIAPLEARTIRGRWRSGAEFMESVHWLSLESQF